MLSYLVPKLKIVTIKSIFQRNKYPDCRRYLSNNFTSDEQKYILEQINDADVPTLQRYNFPKSRIKKLQEWKNINGKFNALNDILEVEGWGVKSLDKICKNILQGNEIDNLVRERPAKGRGQYVTPALNAFHAKDLISCLGINLYATGISWARIEKQNNCLTDWNYFEFNLGTKKLSPIDALQLVMDVSKEIPTSDVYIFEAPIAVTPTAQQSAISVAAYVQRIQLLSMLITLLSTSQKHNPQSISDLVYFLRHKLAARLFRTLIGTEKVSAATTVSNILENKPMEKIIYTPLTTNENLCSMYEKQSPVVKEVLGQALFLTMAFMDVCVYQNKNSLKIVSSNR